MLLLSHADWIVDCLIVIHNLWNVDTRRMPVSASTHTWNMYTLRSLRGSLHKTGGKIIIEMLPEDSL